MTVKIEIKTLREENEAEMVQLIQSAPPAYLDPSMVELANKWSAPPKAIEVLEVLDKSVHKALAAPLAEQLIESVYNEALERENTTHAEVVKGAIWRPENERTEDEVCGGEV